MIVPSCLCGTAMGHALSRRPAQQADDQVARRHFEPPGRIAARGDPFAMVEALAAAGGFDRSPAQFQRGDARPQPDLAAAVQLDEHRTPLLARRQLAQRG